MILRLLNIQGIAGLAVSLALLGLLLVQKGETRHWRKQSSQFEQLYRGEHAALAGTVANYRAASAKAAVDDRANAARVAAEQRTINERTEDAYEKRIADARAAAERMRVQLAAAADPGSRPGAPMPGLSAAAQGAAQAAGENRLSQSDALTATEQAIQLDELIKWVRAQAKVDNSSGGGPFEAPSDR